MLAPVPLARPADLAGLDAGLPAAARAAGGRQPRIDPAFETVLAADAATGQAASRPPLSASGWAPQNGPLGLLDPERPVQRPPGLRRLGARICLKLLADQLDLVNRQALETDRLILASARAAEVGRR